VFQRVDPATGKALAPFATGGILEPFVAGTEPQPETPDQPGVEVKDLFAQ
jgi:hypothetical protein